MKTENHLIRVGKLAELVYQGKLKLEQVYKIDFRLGVEVEYRVEYLNLAAIIVNRKLVNKDIDRLNETLSRVNSNLLFEAIAAQVSRIFEEQIKNSKVIDYLTQGLPTISSINAAIKKAGNQLTLMQESLDRVKQKKQALEKLEDGKDKH